MPGNDERRPADADRAPASRVGDELQERAEGVTGDVSPDEAERIEADAVAAAERKGWDQAQTEQERSAPT